MKVRLEPIGEEIDCAADETVLDAAFRQGYNLVYGCREGQCSACKCFLQEGDVALKRYSNFALSDSERERGYSLMCRAMPEQDLVVELLHHDPLNYRIEHAIRDGEATVEAIEPLTRDITRLVLSAPGFTFTPGQYVELHVPGHDGARRSFSMANLPGDERIELIIRRYPGGRLSGRLDGQIQPGDRVAFTGPYGAFRVRESEHPILMIAGGAGMAPILSVLRQLARDGCERPVRFFYGARTEADLFGLDEIERLGSAVSDFRFTAVVQRFIHESVDDYLSTREIAAPDVYMCGPPPMIEAAQAMLTGAHGLDEARIFSDKFTTSADAAQPAPTVKRVDTAPAPAGHDAERDFTWYTPRKRRGSLYEDVTIDTQPSIHRHLTRGWPVSFEDGRGTWNDDSTRLRSSDWYAFRDPDEQWERPFYQRASAVENQIESAMRSAAREGLIADFTPEWVNFLKANLQVAAYIEHGLWFALATIGRDCLSDSVATCVCLHAAMKQRSAQALVLYAMDLEEHHGPFPIEEARNTFLHDERWQPTRRYVERLAATSDWAEVIVAANVCFEPIVGTMLRRELGIRAAAGCGDTVTPVLAQVANHEWEWARGWTTELIRMLLADPEHGAHNRATIDGWLADWQPGAQEAADALGSIAAVDAVNLSAYAGVVLAETGLDGARSRMTRAQPTEARLEAEPAASSSRPADRPTQRVPPTPARRAPAADPPAPTNGDGGYDYVGIVMAKSAEGDAVAEILGRREGVEVIEQPSFWDIRAKVRLALPYAEISEQLGYAVDAYSIQHEMSTHYGRMVATDDSLMLFSDPTEAMRFLISAG